MDIRLITHAEITPIDQSAGSNNALHAVTKEFVLSVYEFLSILPAILAIVGFIAFFLLRGKLLDDQIVRDIVSKLRNQGNIDPSQYAAMTPWPPLASLR